MGLSSGSFFFNLTHRARHMLVRQRQGVDVIHVGNCSGQRQVANRNVQTATGVEIGPHASAYPEVHKGEGDLAGRQEGVACTEAEIAVLWIVIVEAPAGREEDVRGVRR